MKILRGFALGLIVAGLLALTLAGCSAGEPVSRDYGAPASSSDAPAVIVPELSATAQAGEQVFNANCALCHGPNASGTSLGPPLVHKIYEPGHHQDFSFQSAVRNGVPAHHWQFGNMPPVPAVSDQDVPNIICYIRELQRANGIIAPEASIAAC